jgi:hypothetical protein
MNIKLQDIKTVFINPDEGKYKERKPWVEKILREVLKIKKVEHCKSSISKTYCQELKKITANILEANLNDEPILIVEDDINITHWYLEKLNQGINIDIPENADAVYLGLYRYGIHPTKDGLYPQVASLSNKNPEIVQIFNMLSGHAIIYKSKKYKEDIIRMFRDENNKQNNDVILARNLNRFNIYAYKKPIFFQDKRFNTHDIQWCTYIQIGVETPPPI